jgi:predicted metal-dependent hydrolase
MIHGQPRGWNRAEFGAYLGALGRDEELATRFVNVFSHGVPAGEMFSIEARDQWREQRTEAETTGSRTSV